MNKLNTADRAAIIRTLVEGNSVRATARMTGTSKGTVLRLLVEVGEFCEFYQDYALVNLKCERVEADEIWGYVGAKEANKTKPGQGDLWTYIGVCAESKLVVSWLVGARSGKSTRNFMSDLASRLAKRVQVSTDGLKWYLSAVENAFGYNGADFGQIRKIYGNDGDERGRGRYSPSSVVIEVKKDVIFGDPDVSKISTSYVERQNLTVRMGMRRMTRLTNGFSKKAENHAHAFAIHMMHYNFCRSHQTLTKKANGIKTTPAMACGLTDHVWTVEEVLEKMDPNFLLH